VRIRRSFCIASKETTVAQFHRFLADHSQLAAPGSRSTLSADVARADVSWFEAAAYCNWLSAEEGIPRDQWCYEPRADGTYGPGMQVAPDFGDRRGYRLPTEPEWEYACRAGTQSDYFFGNNANHLRYYGLYRENADYPQAVGTCKPNDFGLFDMSGNVAEWCQDAFPLRSAQSAGDRTIGAETERVIRGGSFADAPPRLQSSSRASSLPLQRNATVGFRVARTYP
jgi:formylglycine-generating enzyme required for sulfatase activity